MTEAENKEKEKEKELMNEYEALRKKYQLPELIALEKEFSIGKLEETPNLLRSVMLKISERVEWIYKTLSEIIQPSESSLSAMYEAEVFSDEEKKTIFELMKKMAYHYRDLMIKDYDYKEEESAELIKKIFSDWVKIKPEILKIMTKLRDSWNKDRVSKFEAGYFG